MIVLAGTHSDTVQGAASQPGPRVTTISQVTHDGYRKDSLLSDQSQLYVTERPVSAKVIARVSLPSSTRSELSSPFSSAQVLDVSPDRSKLLISTIAKESGEAELWTIPVSKGNPQRVGTLSGRDASWSRDGGQLAYAQGPVLYLANGKGNQSHELYRANGSVFAVHFSPDGTKVRFSVNNPDLNTTTLWEINRDGSDPQVMLANWAYGKNACCGNWTADGHYYFFQTTQNMPHTWSIVNILWALDESKGAGAEPVQITEGPMSFSKPSPARDHNKVWAIGVQPGAEVVKFDTTSRKYVPLIPGLSATDVNFSSDGKWIAYVTIPEGSLWRSRVDGSERLQLTSGADRAALPVWSPDGKQIAFVSMKPGESWKMYLMPVDGGTPQPVVKESGGQIDANWSADGSQLMFGDYRSGKSHNIRILDFKTGTVTKVPGSEEIFSPRWSPDGKHIAAMSLDNTTLMLFDFQTGKWSTWVIRPAGTVSYPLWSKDSQYIYFDDLVNGTEAVRRIKVGASEPEEVVALEAFDRYPGILGTWFGRASDGSWLFARDRSTQEIYQLSLDLQ